MPNEKEPECRKLGREWIALAKTENPCAAKGGFSCAGRIGAPAAPALIELVKDERLSIRAAAAGGAAEIRPNRRRSRNCRLHELFINSDEASCRAAIECGEGRRPESRPVWSAIVGLLKDKDAWVREAAPERLLLTREAKAVVPALAESLNYW